MKKALAFTSAATLLTPFVASAQTTVRNISDVGSFIINIINNILVPVLFAIAFIVFLWGAFTTFIRGHDDSEVKDKGKNLMLWGLIGFFVMISIWGLVNILTGSVNFGNSSGPSQTPQAGFQVGR